MADLLRIHIEAPGDANWRNLTPEALRDTIEQTFVELGVPPDVVKREIESVAISKESPLGIDPGTAAFFVALIGVGVELIKLGVDLYKQRNELETKAREQQQNVALELAKIKLEEKKLEAQAQKQPASQSKEPITDEDLRAFLGDILVANLVERHRLQDIECWVERELRS